MQDSTMIVRVAIPSPLRRLFDYLPTASMRSQLKPGVRVKVPFGRKQVIGTVVELANSTDCPANKLKVISQLIDQEPLLQTQLLQLLVWAANYYQHPIGEVLQQALPIRLRQGEKAEIEQISIWSLSNEGEQIEREKMKRAPKQWQVISTLRELKSLQPEKCAHSSQELTSMGITTAQLKILKNKNLVLEAKSSKINELNALKVGGPVLNAEQDLAVKSILAKQSQFSSFLLQGITGSGKTEVYLCVLEQLLQEGVQALVLVPEIGLTPQTIARFEERLHCRIAVLHSGLSDTERANTWLLAKNGDISVIIGTRSSIFTPFKCLKCIIVDESHDNSFKQWEGFKYQARDLAIRRAQLENIPVILGSATPSLSSLYNVIVKKFTLLSLTKRATGASLPKFIVVDMRRQQSVQGISSSVIKAIQLHLEQGSQVLVFLNRRGYAPSVLCHDCGWVAECGRCNTPLTKHHSPPCLQCHHCGKTKSIIAQCQDCGSEQLIDIGLGTERVEQALAQKFAKKKIVRIDRDTTRKKGALVASLNSVNSGHADILIGTQMLAKGHHFPNVTLVVMLDIDGGLYSADFNASEQMAQLLLQVSGRAGREQKPGEVLLQTHQPEHPLLQNLMGAGYMAFAKQLLHERKQASLPPYQHMALFRASSVERNAGEAFLEEVSQLIAPFCSDEIGKEFTIFGPLIAPMEKRVGQYRWQLILTASARGKLNWVLKQSLPNIELFKSARKVRWAIDIDPINIL